MLSDHGQSQGATFRQRYGQTLEEVVASHRRPRGGLDARTRTTTSGPARTTCCWPWRAARTARRRRPPAPVVTVASGNLAMLYLTEHPGRATVEEIGAARPALIQGLAEHPGIGLVVGCPTIDGPVAFGPDGRHRLRDGHVDGERPAAAVRAAARARPARPPGHGARRRPGAGQPVDPGTDEVAAFEELVGSHGGIGGWQTEAILVLPGGVACLDRAPVGPAAVHRQLVQWLDDLGLRGDPADLWTPRRRCPDPGTGPPPAARR